MLAPLFLLFISLRISLSEQKSAYSIIYQNGGGGTPIGKIIWTQAGKEIKYKGTIYITRKVTSLDAYDTMAIYLGFHVHEKGTPKNNGDCEKAGSHFNPHNTSHSLPEDPIKDRHVGDLGNIRCDPIDREEACDAELMCRLSCQAEKSDKIISFTGKENILGKSIVLHKGEDNYGQPTGNAGGKYACGNIIECTSKNDEQCTKAFTWVEKGKMATTNMPTWRTGPGGRRMKTRSTTTTASSISKSESASRGITVASILLFSALHV